MRARLALALVIALVVAGGATAAILLTGGNGGAPATAYRGSIPPLRIELPDFELRDSAGRTTRSAELRGRVVLVTFLDTQCRSACPVIASQIGLALDRLSPDQLRDVVPLAITSDPPEDMPASVRAFPRRHRVEGRLRYLIGSVDELRPVWEASSVAVSFDTGVDDLHSAPVRIYDRRSFWVSTRMPAPTSHPRIWRTTWASLMLPDRPGARGHD